MYPEIAGDYQEARRARADIVARSVRDPDSDEGPNEETTEDLRQVVRKVPLLSSGSRRINAAGDARPRGQDEGGSAAAIAASALTDGVPESAAIGISPIESGVVSPS